MSIEDGENCKDENAPAAASDTSELEALLGHCYEICIGGQLDSSWSEWFEGFEISGSGQNWTMLCGHVADQAALLGILNKLCRLNLPLLSINEVGWVGCCTAPKKEGAA